jgi:mRNA-degrading endonuclease toxin of MazEF toxin-antitoxin module
MIARHFVLARLARSMARATPSALAIVLCLTSGRAVLAQELELPPRRADALGGAEIARQIRSLDLEAREDRIYAEIALGNVPTWLRALAPVEVEREIKGRRHHVTFWVTPDYLAVGSDRDYFRVPLTPYAAQRVADLVGGSLPTPLMVDDIWAAAAVRLAPLPIPPSPQMTTVGVFRDHDRRVRSQRARNVAPIGVLIAGHKKDVVITAALASLVDRVAIYGWHLRTGEPIQRVHTGHGDGYVDYSHGIRLVQRAVRIDGTSRDLADILSDERLAPLLSNEGVIREPRYRQRRQEGPG